MEREVLKHVLSEHFRGRADLAAVYLFGSVATGRDRRDSDVDVGVLYARPPPASLLGQPYLEEADLTERLDRTVQIVVMNGAPVDLVHRILRDGIVLVERDKSARIAFEVEARNRYFDLLPVLREYRSKASA